MKSKMKKLVSLVLAMAMVLTMSIGMSATRVEATESYTITINNTSKGHTYEAYQIFKGTLSNDESKLSDIDWGTGVDTSNVVDSKTLIQAIQAITDTNTEATNANPFKDCTTAEDVADVLANYTNDNVVAQAFADVVAQYLTNTKTESICNYEEEGEGVVENYTISGLEAGYYLIKDQDDSLDGDDDAYTDYVLKVVKNESLTPKSSTPEVVKKVEEINDADSTATAWQDAADYDIGDSINYMLTGTLPETLSTYSVYYYQFTDTLSAGLTVVTADTEIASSDVTVNVVTGDTTTVVSTSCYSVKLDEYAGSNTTYTGGHVLTVSFDNVLSLKDETSNAITVTSTSKIVVTYSATLNNDANIGTNGNPNEVYLTYSNNPNNAGSGETGQTPEDKVTVFTFELDVNKVESDNTTPLEGAGFTLYKFIGIGKTDADEEGYVVVGNEVKGTNMTTFVFKGLDSGKYKIVESTVPDGYNKADNIYFQIVATYDKEKTDPALTELVIKDLEGNTISGTEGSFSVTETTFEKISTNVVNKSGSVLPSTGGIGTTIFYIVGAILVLGAGVILVTRRRTRA